MKNRLYYIFLILSIFSYPSYCQNELDTLTTFEEEIEIAPVLPDIILNSFEILVEDTFLTIIGNKEGHTTLFFNGETKQLDFSKGGLAVFPFTTTNKGELLLINNKTVYKLYHISKNTNGTYRIQKIPMWLSLLPPLIAIALALIFKEVIVSLFVGVWVGAFIAGGMRIESIYYFLLSIWEVVQKYILEALTDSGHIAIIVFSLLIGGMVALISRNGGMAGVVKSFSKYAKSPRSAQFITWLLGVAIFFDDYSNTLIVGNTMRSVTDRFKISREKLAYIVDSTAAPVAAIAFITTWIGAELGYIEDGVSKLTDYNGSTSPYSIFISSLKYSFYPVLTLIFILIIIYTKKDFGPMFKAEHRARTTGQVSTTQNSADEGRNEVEDLAPVKNAPLRWFNAGIPVFTVIFMTIFGLTATGFAGIYSELITNGTGVASENWGDIWAAMVGISGEDAGFFQKIGKLIGNSDSYVALLWASISGVGVALILTLSQKIMKLEESVNTVMRGFNAMLPALIILTLAWSLAATTNELNTATYLTFALQDSVNPYLMPMIIFILAALIAFSTGSSWSTMAILYPIAIPTTWAICQSSGIDATISYEILLNVIAVTLAASVLGDHCSPISDTTILSSLASDCNHIDHVRTQLPYALVVGAVSILAGGLATFFGGGWLVSFILLGISVLILWGVVWKFGKRVDS